MSVAQLPCKSYFRRTSLRCMDRIVSGSKGTMPEKHEKRQLVLSQLKPSSEAFLCSRWWTRPKRTQGQNVPIRPGSEERLVALTSTD